MLAGFPLLCRFRVSAHRRNVESGRYRNIKREDGLCTCCKVVESEKHFLLECARYSHIRQTFLVKLLNNKCSTYFVDEMFTYIMTQETLTLIEATASDLLQCFEIRGF